MKLKNVIVYSIYIAQDIAQLDLLHCEQVYEYEIQLLSYIQTSYLVFWTWGRDIKPPDCGITTSSNSWKRLWLPPHSPTPRSLSGPKLAWNSNPFPRIPPPQAGNGETKPGAGQRVTPHTPPLIMLARTRPHTHTHSQPNRCRGGITEWVCSAIKTAAYARPFAPCAWHTECTDLLP